MASRGHAAARMRQREWHLVESRSATTRLFMFRAGAINGDRGKVRCRVEWRQTQVWVNVWQLATRASEMLMVNVATL